MIRDYIVLPTILRRLPVAVCLCLLAFVCVLPQSAHATGMELSDLVLDNEKGNVTVRFSIAMDTFDELEAELEAGNTVRLTCNGNVYRQRSMWADASVAEGEWVSYLSKDVLANSYKLVTNREKPVEGKSLRELLKKSWLGLTMNLGPWSALESGRDYRLVLSLNMDRTETPVWLRYMLFFWSFDVYPERTYQLDFSY